jgi:hypothetical protein
MRQRRRIGRGALLHQAGELLLEARDAAAAIEDLLLTAGPGRVRLGVDVEVQRVAFLALGRAGQEFGPVGHDDLNRMIIRVNFGFHGKILNARKKRSQSFSGLSGTNLGRSISQDGCGDKLGADRGGRQPAGMAFRLLPRPAPLI